MKVLNKVITIFLMSSIAVTQCVLPVSAQTIQTKTLSQAQLTANQIDALLTQQQKNAGFSGTVILTQKGKTLLSKSYGYANEEYKVATSQSTVYRYASLTKQFTAAAILKLAEQGKLKVNDPIGLYLKDFPNGDQITVKMLLNHTSGLRDDVKSSGKTNEELLKVYHSPNDLLALIAKEPLGSVPGQSYYYSNHGYILLGNIIEKVSGKSYETYLKEQFLTPLGISGIQLDNTQQIIANRAEGYRGIGAKKMKADAIDMSNAFSAGGLVGTASSYLKWQQNYYNPKILSKESWEQMFNADVKTLRTPLIDERYGYGIMSTTLSAFGSNSYKVLYHTGAVNGFRNFQMHIDALGIDLVLLSNNESIDLESILTQILLAMLGLLG